MNMRRYLSALPALLLAGSAVADAPKKAADLFQTSKVWTVHLKFAPEQWAAIEPKGGGGMMFGMRGPGGHPGGPGGGPPGGGFGISMLLAPAFLKGDSNNDKQLSSGEFQGLANGWFSQWDKSKSGSLEGEELRTGTASLFEAGIAAMMGGGRPGGPGGFGGAAGLVAPKGKRNGISGMSGIDFENVHADLDFDGQTFTDVAVRYKGNGTFMQSRGRDKKSFKIDVHEYKADQRIAGTTKFNLHCNVTDASWMNEVLSYQLYRDAKVASPRTAYARVYVSVAGKYERKYFGLYSLVEDIGSEFEKDNYAMKDGLFLKPATRDIFGYLGDDWEPYDQPYAPKGKPTAAQQKRVIDFARLLTKGSDEEFRAQAGSYLNVEQMARYMAVTVWLSTLDSILGMGQNYFLYLHPKTNKFELLPWDLDHSFGQFPMAGTQEQRENLSILQPWQGDVRFLQRLYALPEFREIYLAKFAEYEKTIFEPGRFAGQVDTLAKVIRPAVEEESAARVQRFDKVVAGESVTPEAMGFGPPPGAGGPGGPPPGGGFGGFGNVKPIKGFVRPRAQSVADQVSGKSKGIVRPANGGGFGGPPGGMRGLQLDKAWLEQFDADKDGVLSESEFQGGFAKWFTSWNSDKSGQLTEAQLREGINRDMNPFRGMMPGPPPPPATPAPK